MLNTPYYRTLTQTHSLGCDDLPDANYVPYDIFCLETRLYPSVYSLLGRDVQLLFKTVNINERMELKIEIQKIADMTNQEPSINPILIVSEEIKEKLQKKVNEITSKYVGYCFIDREELLISARRRYPIGWFHSVLRYTDISSAYSPFYHESGIYLAFNPYSDYKAAYLEINDYLLRKVEEYYEQGVIYGAKSIAKKWRLEPLDNQEIVPKLYGAAWSDKRVAPDIICFLLERLQGDKFIRIQVSDNLVKRHKIILELSRYNIPIIIENGYLKIECDNIEDAQYFASIIHSSSNLAVGKVITKNLDSMEKVNMYVDAANKLLNCPECVGYQTSSGYIFSCLVDMNAPEKTILGRLEDLAFRYIPETKK